MHSLSNGMFLACMQQHSLYYLWMEHCEEITNSKVHIGCVNECFIVYTFYGLNSAEESWRSMKNRWLNRSWIQSVTCSRYLLHSLRCIFFFFLVDRTILQYISWQIWFLKINAQYSVAFIQPKLHQVHWNKLA